MYENRKNQTHAAFKEALKENIQVSRHAIKFIAQFASALSAGKRNPLKQIQKFHGHSKIETTQIYAESSTEMMKERFKKAFTG